MERKISKTFTFQIPSDAKKERMDIFLSEKLEITRNRIQKLIKEGFILLKDKPAKSSSILRGGDRITVYFPEVKEQEDLVPQNIPLDVIFEDREVLVINKPAGLVVHPAKGHSDNTLVNAILFHCPDLPGINDEMRPGIVHRLDMDTSGIMMIAKTQGSHNSLTEQLKERKIKKEYLALVKGIPRPMKGTIKSPVGRHPVNRKKMAVTESGKEAVTDYNVEKIYSGDYSLLRLVLKTGRTHQIRVHLSYINHPILGDPLYGGKQKGVFGLTRQALHACKLGFYHPISREWMEFSAPVADDIKVVINKLERQEI